VEALEALANAVESDLAEIKAALSQLAADDDRASSRPRRS
jgi:DNA polymerase III delta subunit